MIKTVAYTPIYTSATWVYAKSGLSSTEVDLSNDDILRNIIEDSENEVSLITARKFTDANAMTEYLNTGAPDVLQRMAYTLRLSYKPIQSVSILNLLDINGGTTFAMGTLTSVQVLAGTFQNTDYWLDVQADPLTNLVVPNGRIILKTSSIPSGYSNVKVTYTYGYTTVPIPIRDLATCLASIRMWVRFMGGNYNRLNSYEIPQQIVAKGDFFTRGLQAISTLEKEAQRLLDRIGRKPRTLAFATSGDR